MIVKYKYIYIYTGGPPYSRIQYPRFQLSAVDRDPKEIGKLKKQMVHKFQKACQAITGRNMVKSSSPKAHSI